MLILVQVELKLAVLLVAKKKQVVVVRLVLIPGKLICADKPILSIIMLLTLLLTTKGVAAVPRASLVVLAATLTAFNLPLAGVAVILGIDHFLDMGRTSINLVGNCVATAVVARWEGVLDDEKMGRFGTDDEDVYEDDLVSMPA